MTQALLLGASIALSLAIAVVLWRDARIAPPVRWTGIALAAAGAAYGLLAGPLPLSPAATLLVRIAAGCGTVLLWSLVRLLFDARYTVRQSLWMPGAIAAVFVLLPFAAAAALAPAWQREATALVRAGAVWLSIHLLWLLIAGRRDDLDPYRRWLRLLLAGGGAVYVIAVLGAGYFGVRAAMPLGVAAAALLIQIALKLAFLGLAIGHPSPLARLWDSTHDTEPQPWQTLPGEPTGSADAAADEAAPHHPAAPPPSVAEAQAARQAERIVEAMTAGQLHRRQNFGIGQLAEHMNLPEHRVRAVINGHLGFRNYSAFLNHFRLRDVAKRLRDPAQAHLPILSIALDCGYASIGPFNRAFREAFGVTPTDYRRGAGGAGRAEMSERRGEFGNGERS